MRTPIIVGNWKMNKLRSEAETFMNGVEAHLTGEEKADYGIAAPFTCVDVCVKNAKHLIIAAENCNEKDSGAFTGEVSVPMLEEIGITYCIIGHSERRTYYNETNHACALKAKRLFASNIVPILCIGETEAEYDAGKTAEVVKTEIKESLEGLTAEEVSKMVIAYEPIWAIGTGKTATNEIAEDVCGYIRGVVAELYGQDVAEKVRIQYGGSVKPATLKELLEQPNIDGALVGGASLQVESYVAMIEALND